MFVSKQLKEKNIAEYLIYMWQIEDLIRANGCDIGKDKKHHHSSLSVNGRAESGTHPVVYGFD